MKKLIIFILIAVLFSLLTTAYAQESNNSNVNLYFFWEEGCPHCAGEKVFLSKLEQKYPNLKIHSLEVVKNRTNAQLLEKVGKRLNADVSGVPFTVVCDKYFIGWYNEETTGRLIENAIQSAASGECNDIVSQLESESVQEVSNKTIPEQISLPVFGQINIKNVSLPILTIIFGFLDGFNPCAMWVLLFLISLLLGMKDRKRMWIFGSVFIAAESFVYFLFMTAWLNLLLFLGFVFWIRIAIGGVALWAGYYNLKEYITNPESGCKVAGEEKRQATFEKIRKIIHEKSFIFALLGLIALAFGVNLVEFVCSAGLPAVYTQILALNNLPTWQYYAYISLYIFMYMLDDLIVFITAMITLQLTGISTKYGRISHLIGGIIMLIIGILLIFKPELLMFG